MVDFKDYTVLVVEDEDTLRESFSRCLSMLFKKVYTSANGENGLQEWSRYSPDIVITDIYLPKMSGIELCKLIRERDLKIPILFMSAHSDPHTFMETIPVSADGFLIKPFTFESCLENLQKCVNKLEERRAKVLRLKNGAFVNIITKNVVLDGITTTLSPQEAKLISLFVASADTTLHQNAITNALWNGEIKSQSALKNLLLKLRKKLGANAIDTLIGHGYKLNIIS